jgi:peptidoglycan hydrolase-like protein with peptidoglycan-binding domain
MNRANDPLLFRLLPLLIATFVPALAVFSSITASAAPLNYSADTTISLISPAINFTVVSGSMADVLTVNATSAIVTMSNTTGGSFTLTSASRDLTITASAGGGSISTSCSGVGNTFGTASTTISQTSGSASYTIVPTGSACIVPQGAVTGAGGGGGGSLPPSPTPPPVSTSTTAAASSTAPVVTGSGNIATSSLINASSSTNLLQQLLALVGQVRILSVGMLSQENHGDLTVGAKGKDVWALQVFLIANNILAPVGPATAKLMNPTSYFGYITQGSLAEYQTSVSIVPLAGYFGPKTRTYLFSTYLPNGSSTSPIPPVPTPAPSASSTSALPVPPQLFLKPLRWNMHDPDVARLQAYLAKNPAIYPEGNATGYFGDATLSAVQRFQLKYNLAHDGDIFYGYVGPQTRAKLNALIAAGQTP